MSVRTCTSRSPLTVAGTASDLGANPRTAFPFKPSREGTDAIYNAHLISYTDPADKRSLVRNKRFRKRNSSSSISRVLACGVAGIESVDLMTQGAGGHRRFGICLKTPTEDPDHLGFSVQTDLVRVRGVEFEGTMKVGHSLTAYVSYTYLDPKVIRSNDPTEVGNMPRQTLVDLALHRDFGKIRFAVNATNVFDKRYIANPAQFYGRARAVQTTIGYRF